MKIKKINKYICFMLFEGYILSIVMIFEEVMVAKIQLFLIPASLP